MVTFLLSRVRHLRRCTGGRVPHEADGRGVRPCGALVGGEPTEQHQGRLPAARTGQAQSWCPLGRGRYGRLPRRQQELESLQREAVRRVEQAEGADPVQSPEGDVLEEAAQELVRGEGHGLAPLISVVSVAEGHRAIVGGDDGLVRDRGLVDVAPEVLEDLVRALDDGFGEDDPALAPGDVRERDARQSAPREAEEAPAKELGERLRGDEVEPAPGRRGDPRDDAAPRGRVYTAQ